MFTARKMAVGFAATSLLSAGLLSAAAPADAFGGLVCESGPDLICSVDDAVSPGEVWTLNGTSIAYDTSDFSYHCSQGDYGHWFTVGVTYTNTSGSQVSPTGQAQCRTVTW